jgi:hypothetical protein
MEIRTTGQILVDVLKAREWFESIGIPTTGTRIEAIRDYLYEHLDPITPADENTYYALSDGTGFGLIATEMSKLSPQILRRRSLQDILKGPLLASEEVPPINDHARNIFLELELAAYCSSTGFKILGLEDLNFEFEAHRYFVQCKRPFREENLDYHMKRAYCQLKKQLVKPSDRGIVAVAVEKMFGLDRQFHPVESASSASEFAVSVAKQFGRKIVQYNRTWVDTRIVGFLAIIRFLTKTGEQEQPCANYIPVLVKRASPQVGQAAESERLDSMMKALQQKFRAP